MTVMRRRNDFTRSHSNVSNKEHKYQQVLAEINLKTKNKSIINTRITPEPQNCFDSRAIAVEVETDKWERIGYLITDVLEFVHEALAKKKLVSVEMCWVKFITHALESLWSGMVLWNRYL